MLKKKLRQLCKLSSDYFLPDKIKLKSVSFLVRSHAGTLIIVSVHCWEEIIVMFFLTIAFPIFKSSALYGNTLVSLMTDWPLGLTMRSQGGDDDDDRDLSDQSSYLSARDYWISKPGGAWRGDTSLQPTQRGRERSFLSHGLIGFRSSKIFNKKIWNVKT